MCLSIIKVYIQAQLLYIHLFKYNTTMSFTLTRTRLVNLLVIMITATGGFSLPA